MYICIVVDGQQIEITDGLQRVYSSIDFPIFLERKFLFSYFYKLAFPIFLNNHAVDTMSASNLNLCY